MGIISRSQGGGGGGGAVLFDSTLGAPAALIDTGAGGIAATQNVLEIWVIARTDAVAAVDSIGFRVNNDATAIYDRQSLSATNAAVTGAPSLAQTQWLRNCHGNGGLAGYPSIFRLTLPGYAQTTFNKVGELTETVPDSTAANDTVGVHTLGWRSTVAISRFQVLGQGGANLLAGSRLLILGR